MSYEKAPRPSQNGRCRNLYDVVDGLGGATLEQVHKYLPTINASYTKGQVKKGLYNCVYRGFLIMQDNYYRVAPMDYYKTRNTYIKNLNLESAKRRDKREAYRKKKLATHQAEVVSKEKPVKREPKVIRDTGPVMPVETVAYRPDDELTIHIPHWVPPFVIGLVIGGMVASSILVMTGV